MTWLHLIAIGAAGIASMKSAFEAGDIEEAGRQGVLAGPRIVEAALASPDRATRMAAIAATPATDDRIELLEALATAATGPDRRSAIPAARAARTIARELADRVAIGDLPDDVAAADVAEWRDDWAVLARDRSRWIELRVLAVEVTAALDAALRAPAIGVDLAAALADADPAFRRAAASLAPVPLPVALRAPLANTVVTDTDPFVALGAAQALCADLASDPAAPILAALGAPGLVRLRAIIATDGASRGVVRDAARCLAADPDPESAKALRSIRARLR